MQSSPSSQAATSTAAGEALEKAGNLVDAHVAANQNFLDLSALLGATSHQTIAVSGLQDQDYPAVADGALSEISSVKRVPLPPELLEQFASMQCNCSMGLFTQISRAWLTIDSDIFVWNYEDGSDIAFYDQLNETILAVGLVKPKPDIFKPDIRFLLVLVTSTDILLLGVAFAGLNGDKSDPSFTEMHLLPDPLFSLPTDNTLYVCVAGTENGRIFLGGKDSNLTEIDYQAQDGWFTRKCRKINHSRGYLSLLIPAWIASIASEDDSIAQICADDSRSAVYTRSSKGTIACYDARGGAGSLACVARLTEAAVAHAATNGARTDRSNFREIVHVAAVTARESANIHLIALTSSGARLYFATSPFGTPPSAPPSGLYLVAVRLPPGFAPTAAVPRRPSNIHSAHSRRGTALMAQAQTDDNDLLWILSSDAFAFQRQLMETQATLGVEGRIWAMDEIPSCPPPLPPPISPQHANQGAPPLVVTQHMESPRSFVIVNAQGTHLMTKLRPVDQLRELLLKTGTAQSGVVESFFRLNSADQACATALMLACSRAAVDAPATALAADAFFIYGGETTVASSSHLAPATIGATSIHPDFSFNPNLVSTPAQPQHQSALHHQPPQMPLQTYTPVFSNRHKGLCLYLARLVAPFWNARVVKEVRGVTDQVSVSPSFLGEDLAWFLQHIYGLREFLDANASLGAGASPTLRHDITSGPSGDATFLFAGSSASNALLNSQRRALAEAALTEKNSLEGLRLLVTSTCESLALWQLLAENQMHVLCADLPQDALTQLKSMTFKTLITTNSGREASASLIGKLIAVYLDDNASTDVISAKLRALCPSLYSSEDATCSKANELLFASKSMSNKAEKEAATREALVLFKSISGSPSFDLSSVAAQFAGVKFFEGIVDLCLAAAERLDPQNLAAHFLRNGEANQPAYTLRKKCYAVVSENLSTLLASCNALPQSPSLPASPGPPSPPQPTNPFTAEEAESAIRVILDLSLKTEEEILHIEIFEWLVARKLQDRLLQIQSPFLETWLKRCMTLDPNNLAFMNLLWKHYEKTRQFPAAAQILAKLAERSGAQLNLSNRMEYLARAAMAAKSAGGSGGAAGAAEAEFLRELEEKIEVARLQLKLLEALQQMTPTPEIQEAMEKLGSDLIDISTLYGDFADPFGLAECKLAIIQCAGHHDPKLVESIWVEIFEVVVRTVKNGDVNDIISVVQSKLRTLGKEYVGLERYFPLPYLVRHLEGLSSRLGASPRWVFTTLLELGVHLSALFSIYHRLLREKDAGISSLHLLTAIYHMLSAFLDDPSRAGPPGSEQRRQFLSSALNLIPGYLVDLEAAPNQTRDVGRITDDFRSLLAQLDKLV